ncbi:hypothetical protein [Plantactinospora sp. CA-290183]|uniref:hypothetical protein n=1 Tax=Plantactinospora sp. CA-290183 TaxID=3240006 RepID=UPI003D93CA8C
MARRVRLAYLLVYLGLVVAGPAFDLHWWVAAFAGVVVMVPVARADIVTTNRQRIEVSTTGLHKDVGVFGVNRRYLTGGPATGTAVEVSGWAGC